MDPRPVPHEFSGILERLAAWPDGVQFFCRGQLECVAIAFGVPPATVEAARAFLETEQGRRAFEELQRTPRSRPAAAPLRSTRARLPYRPRSARELIDRAERLPSGVRTIIETPLETVAILFDVSPFIVLEAREILRERTAGTDPEPGGD